MHLCLHNPAVWITELASVATLHPAGVKTGSHVEIPADDLIPRGFKAKPPPFVLEKSWHCPVFQLLFPANIGRSKHRPTSDDYLRAESRIGSCFVRLGGDGLVIAVRWGQVGAETRLLTLLVILTSRLLLLCLLCAVVKPQPLTDFEILQRRPVQWISPVSCSTSAPGSHFCQEWTRVHRCVRGKTRWRTQGSTSTESFLWNLIWTVPIIGAASRNIKYNCRYPVRWCTVSSAIMF